MNPLIPLDRRGALQAAGLSAAALGLASCAQADVEAAKDKAALAAQSAAGSAIAAAQIPVGGGTIFSPMKVVVTQPTAGDYKAFSSVCTHAGCEVSSVKDGLIHCACHGSTFDIATGEVKDGPATEALPAKKVTLGADGLSIS